MSEVGDKPGLSDDGDDDVGEDMVTGEESDVSSGFLMEDDKDVG